MLGWLYRRAEGWTRNDPRRIASRLDYIPAWFIRRLSQAKLVHLLRYVWRSSPAQRERWKRAGLRLSDLRSSAVLPRIPFTRPVDLGDHGDDYYCAPREDLIHVLTTTGTKGKPKRVYLTGDDFEHHLRMMGTYLLRFPGVTRAMAVYNVDLPTRSAGSVVQNAIERAGILGILSSTGRGVSVQIQLIKDYEIELLATMPAYLHRMTVEAGEDLRQLGIRYILLGGQAWSEDYRTMIEDAWGAKVLDAYGSMELGCSLSAECLCRKGMHIAETDFWVEIVDPASGEVLPDDEEGELVVTTLSRRGMPLVRYRTHDLARMLSESRRGRCACGLPLVRMSRVRGRIDDMLIIGGDANVYGDEWDRALLAIPGVTDYQIIVDTEGYCDALTVRVESKGAPLSPTDSTNSAEAPADLRQTVLNAVLSIPNVAIAYGMTKTLVVRRIEAVTRGTLAEGRSKTRRIVDRRETPTAASPSRATSGPAR